MDWSSVLWLIGGLLLWAAPAHCYNRVNSPGQFAWCGRQRVDPRTTLCCGGLVYLRAGAQPACCGARAYDQAQALCCGGRVARRRGQRSQCCGSRAYDVYRETCASGRVLSKTSHHTRAPPASNALQNDRASVTLTCCHLESHRDRSECCSSVLHRTGVSPSCCQHTQGRTRCCRDGQGAIKCCSAESADCCATPTTTTPRYISQDKYRALYAKLMLNDENRVLGSSRQTTSIPTTTTTTPVPVANTHRRNEGRRLNNQHTNRPNTCCHASRPHQYCCNNIASNQCCYGYPRPTCCYGYQIGPHCCNTWMQTNMAAMHRSRYNQISNSRSANRLTCCSKHGYQRLFCCRNAQAAHSNQACCSPPVPGYQPNHNGAIMSTHQRTQCCHRGSFVVQRRLPHCCRYGYRPSCCHSNVRRAYCCNQGNNNVYTKPTTTTTATPTTAMARFNPQQRVRSCCDVPGSYHQQTCCTTCYLQYGYIAGCCHPGNRNNVDYNRVSGPETSTPSSTGENRSRYEGPGERGQSTTVPPWLFKTTSAPPYVFHHTRTVPATMSRPTHLGKRTTKRRVEPTTTGIPSGHLRKESTTRRGVYWYNRETSTEPATTRYSDKLDNKHDEVRYTVTAQGPEGTVTSTTSKTFHSGIKTTDPTQTPSTVYEYIEIGKDKDDDYDEDMETIRVPTGNRQERELVPDGKTTELFPTGNEVIQLAGTTTTTQPVINQKSTGKPAAEQVGNEVIKLEDVVTLTPTGHRGSTDAGDGREGPETTTKPSVEDVGKEDKDTTTTVSYTHSAEEKTTTKAPDRHSGQDGLKVKEATTKRPSVVHKVTKKPPGNGNEIIPEDISTTETPEGEVKITEAPGSDRTSTRKPPLEHTGRGETYVDIDDPIIRRIDKKRGDVPPDKDFAEKLALCDGRIYDRQFRMCCEGKLRRKIGVTPACCGHMGYDAVLYECCHGNKIRRSCDQDYKAVRSAWGAFI